MKAEYINPFVKSLINAFDTMVNCEVQRTGLSLKDHTVPQHEISGVIGLSGNAIGTVVLSLSESVALQAASSLLMAEYTKLDDDVIDAVGELTNVVAGAAKAELEQYNLSISLPNVITGKGHEVRFPSNVSPICVLCTCPWGDLSLEVGLAEVNAPVGMA